VLSCFTDAHGVLHHQSAPQVSIVEELQVHMEEQDSLITQLQELLLSSKSNQVNIDRCYLMR
jgi:hypothetical protein